MRTDSTRVSDAALNEVRDFIGNEYGESYLPAKANFYKSKKGAQDAHEAIRPTDVTRTPESLSSVLGPDELKLYRLIWPALRGVANDVGGLRPDDDRHQGGKVYVSMRLAQFRSLTAS
jgi:hypothetical protein